MGGFSGGMSGGGGMWWDQAATDAGKGFSSGWQTGSSIATAEYNAAAYKAAAKSLENQARMQSWLVRRQYESEYRELVSKQERQAAMNQVVAAKRGITGDSANAAMQSYAMKDQRNLERLYYNAAMRTGQETMAVAGQAAALREKARQYTWQARSLLIQGVIAQVATFKDYQTQNLQNQETPALTDASPAAQWDEYNQTAWSGRKGGGASSQQNGLRWDDYYTEQWTDYVDAWGKG